MRPEVHSRPLLNQQALDINNAAVASRLSQALPAILRMLDNLQLTREDQAILLGMSTRTLQRALQHGGSQQPALNPDQLTRMSFITGIYKALHILFDDETARTWMHRPNQVRPFLGRTPLAYLRQAGIPGMQDTRRLLDSDRSGRFSTSLEARKAAEHIELEIDPALLK